MEIRKIQELRNTARVNDSLPEGKKIKKNYFQRELCEGKFI